MDYPPIVGRLRLILTEPTQKLPGFRVVFYLEGRDPETVIYDHVGLRAEFETIDDLKRTGW